MKIHDFSRATARKQRDISTVAYQSPESLLIEALPNFPSQGTETEGSVKHRLDFGTPELQAYRRTLVHDITGRVNSSGSS